MNPQSQDLFTTLSSSQIGPSELGSRIESKPSQHVHISYLTPAQTKVWDDYVERHTAGTFFHLSGWKRVMEEGLGHRTHFLLAERAGTVVGVFPLAEVKSLLFGHHLVSLPFCVYGGALCDDPDVTGALHKRARELADNLNVDTLELRHRDAPMNFESEHPRGTIKDLYYTFRKENYLSEIPHKKLGQATKGSGNGLAFSVEDDLKGFLYAYNTLLRDHGTPAFPDRYFHALRESFGDACEITTIRRNNGAVVHGHMVFYFRNECLPYYGGGPRVARDLKANIFAHFKLMERAAERGVQIFDFGRSKKGSGHFTYKQEWGFTPQRLPYEYHLIGATEVPDLNPLNPKFQIAIGVWKRLPVWLARRLGPWASPYLG